MKSYTLKIRGGVEVDSGGKKAGKGALIQEEKSATLGVSQDQILFQAVKSIGFMRGLGGVQTTNEKMPTLQAANLILDDQGGQQISVRTDGKSPTLRAEMHGNLPCVCSAGFKPSQGAKAKGMGFEMEKSPTLLAGQEPGVCITFEPGIASRDGGHVYEGVSGTLRATPGDNQMTVAFTTEMTPKVDTKGKAFSLRERDYKDPQAVVLENHPNDSRVKIDDSGTVQTLTSRCGTGGGNVPMVLEPVCFQQNQREEVRIMDVLGALMAESGMHNTNYVVFSKIRRAKSKDDFETWKQSVCTNTLNTFDQGDVRATDIVVCLPVEHHPQDSRAKISFDGINQPLTSNMEHDPGNGGLVICLQGNGIDRADTAGCNGKGWTENVSYTLNTIDRPADAVCYGNGQVHDAVQMEKEICETLNCMDDSMKVMIRK